MRVDAKQIKQIKAIFAAQDGMTVCWHEVQGTMDEETFINATWAMQEVSNDKCHSQRRLLNVQIDKGYTFKEFQKDLAKR